MAYNLLIVDDSKIVRKATIKTIGMCNIEVSEIYQAENGKEALEVLDREWVDLVFLDINMPVMDGIEFMERVAASEELKQTPVVVCSTEGSKERLQKLSDLGVKRQLRKPISPEIFVQTVNEILGGQ